MTTPTPARTVLVHRKDEEGALIIDAHTGKITQPADEVPAWANGLAVALLAERHGFYTQRLGTGYTDAMKTPDLLAYEDLGWLATGEDGEAVEIEADDEHRREVLAEVLGIDRSADAFDTKSLGEVEIAMDRNRTPEEMAAFEHSQTAGFAEKTGTEG